MKKSKIILLALLLAGVTGFCAFLLLRPNHSQVALQQARLTALEVIYEGAKESFALWELVPDLDWDGLYKTYQKKVKAADSDWEYLVALNRFAAHLGDGRTMAQIPYTTAPYLLPLRLLYVEGQYVVTAAYNAPLREQLGSVVTAINGVETAEFLEDRVGDQTGCHIPNVRQSNLASKLLSSASPDTLTLDCIAPDGSTFTAQVTYEATGLPLQGLATASPAGTPLDGYTAMTVYAHEHDVYQVVLPAFQDAGLQDEFARFIEDYGHKSSAFILDVREHDGGSTLYGLDILTYFSRLEDLTPLSIAGPVQSHATAEPSQFSFEKQALLSQPVVILTHWLGRPVAEDFVARAKDTGRFTIMGTNTAGNIGQLTLYGLWEDASRLGTVDDMSDLISLGIFESPRSSPAMNQGVFSVCSAGTFWADGKDITHVGVPPDIWAEQSVADLQAGRDTVLVAALDYLAEIR